MNPQGLTSNHQIPLGATEHFIIDKPLEYDCNVLVIEMKLRTIDGSPASAMDLINVDNIVFLGYYRTARTKGVWPCKMYPFETDLRQESRGVRSDWQVVGFHPGCRQIARDRGDYGMQPMLELVISDAEFERTFHLVELGVPGYIELLKFRRKVHAARTEFSKASLILEKGRLPEVDYKGPSDPNRSVEFFPNVATAVAVVELIVANIFEVE
ncbi:hypothetical protein PLICRDRAFT_32007 [Plicaturopsis crispa FD-325 SS-3]|uniref:Uncharacterized protein n=1 Tax=Plicaturopsis crispa FD-325 SS-3 TaxID=944288 RepID=A0A0C9SYV2_PLICR|nr:hypothetical protein PLICRDRAFT_32007 [Plicaturopsis crispa FD-325 SS-3]